METGGRFRRAAAVGVLIAAVASGGCGTSSTCPDSSEPDPYPVRSCPDSVLAKLATAYNSMDADAYLDCLADSMSFWLLPEDVGNPDNPLPGCWGKSVEDTIHRCMFGDTTWVDHVSLVMYTETIEFAPGPDPEDPYDDRWVYEQDVDLRIDVGEWAFIANADQLFTFAREPGRCDTLWWIVDWREVDPWERRIESASLGAGSGSVSTDLGPEPAAQDRRLEDSSWGSIKAMFWRMFRRMPVRDGEDTRSDIARDAAGGRAT